MEAQRDRITGENIRRRIAMMINDLKGSEPKPAIASSVNSFCDFPLAHITNGLCQVAPHHRARFAVSNDATLFQPHGTGAKGFDRFHLMAYDKDSAAKPSHVAHPVEAPSLERGVTYGKHFIDDKDVRLKMRGDRKCEPHPHPARVVLNRCVDELLNPRKSDDFIKLACHFPPAHAEHRPVDKDVFATGELRVKSGAYLQQ